MSLSVPFSWENQPGISKEEESSSLIINGPAEKAIKLTTPPPFHHPTRRSLAAAKGLRWDEDPFLVAFMECTKSAKKQGKKGVGWAKFHKLGIRFGLGLGLGLSCKNSSHVREDGMVKRRGL